ncbi:MAG: SRPBCC family protein [Dehalococcoidia bacterium]
MSITSAETRNHRERLGRTTNADVGTIERAISAAGGGALALTGLARRGPAGAALAMAGGWLLYRGATGKDPVYRALGINTAETHPGPLVSVRHKEGIKVKRSVTIGRSRDELFRFWHNFENLPRIMSHLESVTMLDGGRSHWVAKAPAGRTAEWDAVIHTETVNELIAWRSTEGSQIPNAGSVRFRTAPGGRGTEVTVTLEYSPPFGQVGALLATLFGEEPGTQVREDLRRFKALMEANEAPTTAGQPSGREHKTPSGVRNGNGVR